MRRIRFWLSRYLAAEIGGLASALFVAALTYSRGHSFALAAVSGSLAETVGYYGVMVVREASHYYRKHHGQTRLRRTLLTSWHTLRGMLIEFGPAEIVDSLAVRPFLLFALPQLIGNVWVGWIAGKIGADIVFYSFAAVGLWLRRGVTGEVGRTAERQPQLQQEEAKT
jgi:hypothetical protein